MRRLYVILILLVVLVPPASAGQQFIVTWSEYYDENAAGLRVYSSEDQNVWFEEVHHIHQSDTSAIIEPVELGGTLHVVVASFNYEGDEAWSKPASLVVQGPQELIDEEPIEDDLHDEPEVVEDVEVDVVDQEPVTEEENEEPHHEPSNSGGGCFIRTIM